jgi:hypothetical protein
VGVRKNNYANSYCCHYQVELASKHFQSQPHNCAKQIVTEGLCVFVFEHILVLQS